MTEVRREPFEWWVDTALLALIFVKLAITGMNVWTFDGSVYDQEHHLWRAHYAGFNLTKMAYNPPPYYFPAAPIRLVNWLTGNDANLDRWLLVGLRATNVGWLAVFYLTWIRYNLPRLLPDWRGRALASLWLLALPGYQKLAVMVHPDNAFAALAAVTLAAWFYTSEKPATERSSWGPLALATGFVGLTRPFAIVPVAVFWLAGVMRMLGGFVLPDRRTLRPLLYFTVIIGVLAGGWQVARAVAASTVLDAYSDKYIAQFEPYRAGFDFEHYFTSFYFEDLTNKPNRLIAGGTHAAPKRQDRHGNSFFTILYSEVWGDHWLYFSGKREKETKAVVKRHILQAALVPSIWWIGRTLVGMGAVTVRWIRGPRRPAELIVLASFVMGVAMYLWWQTGPALLPGKNSTIKFIYNAQLFPLSLVLAYTVRPSRVEVAITVAVLLLLFGLTLPFVLYLPT